MRSQKHSSLFVSARALHLNIFALALYIICYGALSTVATAAG